MTVWLCPAATAVPAWSWKKAFTATAEDTSQVERASMFSEQGREKTEEQDTARFVARMEAAATKTWKAYSGAFANRDTEESIATFSTFRGNVTHA